MFPITTLYSGIFGLFLIVLSAIVILGRGKYKIDVGVGTNDDMIRRVGVHANFCQYIPLALLLMLLLEAHQVSLYILHAIGIILLLGRILHAYGLLMMEPRNQRYTGRMAGMILTFLVLGTESVYAIYLAVIKGYLIQQQGLAF